MTTRRVLFVDDEANVLAGLRRMLRTKRDVWDMQFANSGDEALALMAAQAVDVVVSDMRMPGMDGAQLLAAVRERHPHTSRLILSGHADQASIISAVGPTQQFLAKPCEVDLLVAVLEHVLAVRDLVTDGQLREVLGGVEALPKPPRVYEEMMAIATNPDCRLDEVIAVIEGDLSTSAEVLRLVNSAFFGLPARVETVSRAVSLLGLDTIQALAVAGAVFGAGGSPPAGLDLEELSSRGMIVGALSRCYATVEGWPRAAIGDAFFAGLLHEVGLSALVMAQLDGWEIYRKVNYETLQQERDAQVEAFGCSATDASAFLLGLWGFTSTVVEAIAGQPAGCDDLAMSAAAHLLTVARHRARFPGVPLPTNDSGFINADRLAAWDEAAAALDL